MQTRHTTIQVHYVVLSFGILTFNVKKKKSMENGSLLIVCSTEKHSHCFLKSTVFCNVPIKVSPKKRSC